MIYFDNAATSFPKPKCVINALNKCVIEYCGNPGRGSHKLSIKSAEMIFSAREEVASLLGGVDAENIVFTYNATYALNFAIKSLIDKDCHVLISDFEHNSVIRPLVALKNRRKIEYSTFSTDGDIAESIRSKIRNDTVAILSSIASNVTGEEISLELLSNIARENNLLLIIDASQAVGHSEINLIKTPCDALCAPGHKALFGIQGCGFVYFKNKERKGSFIEGGSGVDSLSLEMPILLPEGYEGGTLSTPAIVSLGRGVQFVKKIGISEIKKKISDLTQYTKDILSDIPNVTLYKSENGILSFNVCNIPSSIISDKLDRYEICTRSGFHCAPSMHKKLGTIDHGTVRLSYSYFNKKREVEFFAHKLQKTIQELV